MDRVDAQRRLINLEGALLTRSPARSPVRDPSVKGARFPNLVATYWAMIDGDGTPPTQPDFVRAMAEAPLVRKLLRWGWDGARAQDGVLRGGAGDRQVLWPDATCRHRLAAAGAWRRA
jgi:hypothetical protein